MDLGPLDYHNAVQLKDHGWTSYYGGLMEDICLRMNNVSVIRSVYLRNAMSSHEPHTSIRMNHDRLEGGSNPGLSW